MSLAERLRRMAECDWFGPDTEPVNADDCQRLLALIDAAGKAKSLIHKAYCVRRCGPTCRNLTAALDACEKS